MNSEEFAQKIRVALGDFNDLERPVEHIVESVVFALNKFSEWYTDECPYVQEGFCPQEKELKAEYLEECPDDSEFTNFDYEECGCRGSSDGQCYVQFYLREYWEKYDKAIAMLAAIKGASEE